MFDTVFDPKRLRTKILHKWKQQFDFSFQSVNEPGGQPPPSLWQVKCGFTAQRQVKSKTPEVTSTEEPVSTNQQRMAAKMVPAKEETADSEGVNDQQGTPDSQSEFHPTEEEEDNIFTGNRESLPPLRHSTRLRKPVD